MQRKLRPLCALAVLALALYGFSFAVSQAQGPGGGGQGLGARPTPRPINESNDPLLRGFRWRSVGPASMGGRIDDIAAVENNPYIIYVGFATGGLWKSVNNGTTWEPIFDTYSTASIGDIAICQSD